MSVSDYSLSEYDGADTRPDKALVVKCAYENSTKRITFSSTRNCSYDLLRQRVEQCFSLSATPYVITYTDDEGEVTAITTDFDLTEAIRYFHPSTDDPPVSSSASILSGRSFTRGKVTLRVRITVDYDGPSLSDTSSLVSLEEFKNRNGSDSSFSFGSQLSAEPDEDAITVSSKDMGSKYDVYRSRGPKTIVSGPSMEPLINKDRRPKPPSSDWDAVTASYAPGTLESESEVASSSRKRGASPVSITFTNGSDPFNPSRYPESSTSPFERLKLEEGLQSSTPSSMYGSSTLTTERGAAWLRDQNARTMKSMLGDLPTPSESGDVPAPSESYQLSRSSMSGELALEQDSQGKYYFSYSAGPSAASQSAGDDEHSIGDVEQSVAASSRAGDSRPVSADAAWFEGQHAIPTTSNGKLQRSSSSASNPFSDAQMSESGLPPGYIHPDTPLEVLELIAAPPPPPINPTQCSYCGTVLDVIKYVCATCGERRPSPHHSHSDIGDSSKGKSKQIETERDPHRPFAYPPRQLTAPASPSLSSWSVVTDEQYLLRSSSESTLIQKPLPALPPRSVSLPDHIMRLQTGYELCAQCIESAGIDHALMHLTPAISSPQRGNMPSSPEEDQRALSQLRRSAPSQKGQLRHAFIERSWGHFGWSDVEQDDSVSRKCSTCDTVIISQRYKCASCSNFNLCLACYSQVHDIHPSHAFLLVPDKLPKIVVKSPVDNVLPPDGEASMTHPGVRCYHCLMDIVGARFHCAICDSVDICSNCESAGLPGNLDASDGGHVSSHIMIKIPFPVPIAELQSASETAKSIIAGRDPTYMQDSHPRSRRNSFMSSRTVLGSGPRSGGASSHDIASTVSGSLDHGIRCEACGQSIVGTRYQCGNCPSIPRPYSLCAQCEEHSYLVHDPMHIFFKLPRPVDRPLASQYSLLPKLYKRPAGPQEGSPSSMSPDPKEYLRDLVHLKSYCDLCMSPITGAWFRCAYCAKDLCEVCEHMDTHDKTHVFFVLKAPVDMRILGYYANLDNSAESPPFLTHPVYAHH